MAILKSVFATGDYIKEGQVAIEDGFSFEIRLSREEAVKDFDMPENVYDRYGMTIDLSIEGDIVGAQCNRPTKDQSVILVQPISIDRKDNLEKIILDLRLREMVTEQYRSKMLAIIEDVSAKQASFEITVFYGDNYKKYFDGYEDYTMSIYKYGIRMITKTESFKNTVLKKWNVVVPEDCKSSVKEEAEGMAKRYHIRDIKGITIFNSDVNNATECRFDAISEEGRIKGKALVEERTRYPMPLSYIPESFEIKKPGTNIMNKMKKALDKIVDSQ